MSRQLGAWWAARMAAVSELLADPRRNLGLCFYGADLGYAYADAASRPDLAAEREAALWVRETTPVGKGSLFSLERIPSSDWWGCVLAGLYFAQPSSSPHELLPSRREGCRLPHEWLATRLESLPGKRTSRELQSGRDSGKTDEATVQRVCCLCALGPWPSQTAGFVFLR